VKKIATLDNYGTDSHNQDMYNSNGNLKVTFSNLMSTFRVRTVSNELQKSLKNGIITKANICSRSSFFRIGVICAYCAL